MFFEPPLLFFEPSLVFLEPELELVAPEFVLVEFELVFVEFALEFDEDPELALDELVLFALPVFALSVDCEQPTPNATTDNRTRSAKVLRMNFLLSSEGSLSRGLRLRHLACLVCGETGRPVVNRKTADDYVQRCEASILLHTEGGDCASPSEKLIKIAPVCAQT